MSIILNQHDLIIRVEYADHRRRTAPKSHVPLCRIDEAVNFDAARLIDDRIISFHMWGQRPVVEMHVAAGQTMTDAIEQAAAELADPVDPPAFDDADEEALARFAMPLALARISA